MGIQSYAMPHQGPEHAQHQHVDAANANNQGTAAGKKGRAQRELSNTKRAAQNRAAQRAFRLRKEQHINKLEDDLKKYQVMEHNFKTLQQECSSLRNYIARLQSTMTEKAIDFPPVPPSLPLQAVSPPSETQPQPADNQHSYPPTHQHQPAHHDQQHHYPHMSPPQTHSSTHAYPSPAPLPPPERHQHDTIANFRPVNHDPSNDPLPPGAISQLQAAAAQAGHVGGPQPSSAPAQSQSQQQAHPQDPQYVRASEYPDPKRPRLDHSPSGQSRKFDSLHLIRNSHSDQTKAASSDKPST